MQKRHDNIAAQEIINLDLTAQQQEAQKQVDQIQEQVSQLFKLSSLTCKLKMIDYKQNLSLSRVILQNFLKILFLNSNRWKQARSVLKQMEP